MLKGDHQPHIDGLRAVAVLSIVLFHLEIPGAYAGFLGVDIFFVISGYLITGQILRLTEGQTFSLSQFYLRRARRLLPALTVTLTGTLIAGFFFLPPSDLVLLAQALLASEFFYSNFYFWATAGYFSDISQSNLLLHTWSLSVEEQFYLLWPVCLLLTLRLATTKRRILTVMGCLGGSLVAASHWAAVHAPEAAFYLLPFRFHEFLIGAIAAVLGSIEGSRLGGIDREKLALPGTILIILSFALLDSQSAFPGLASLMPALGIAMLLLAPGTSTVGNMLAWRPFRVIGLASYSIYLVHWPLIAFAKKISASGATVSINAGLLFASLILGYCSYRWVEQPFRDPNKAIYRPRLFLPLALASCTMLASWAALTLYKGGFPDRFPQALQMSQADLLAERERYWEQFGKSEASQLRINKRDDFILIIGNSHAQDLVYALRQNALPTNMEVIITPFKCFNFGVGSNPSDDEYCQSARARVLTSPLLSSADRIYLHEDFNGEWVDDLLEFLNSLRARSDAPIYLFGPRLTFKKSVLQIAHEHGRLSGLQQYALAQSFLPKRETLNSKLKEAFRARQLSSQNIHYVDTLALQCGERRDACDIISKTTSGFLYFDISHFTQRGAKEFGLRLKEQRPDLFLAP